MSQISITHSPAEGTLITGTNKGDKSNEILKSHRLRWSRNLESWYLPHSRDNAPRQPLIDALKIELEQAGYTVAISTTNETRTAAEIEAATINREQSRIAALEDKVQRKEKALADAQAREEQTAATLPPIGEPIKIGHHSESKHRKALERSHSATEKVISARNDLKDAQDQLARAKAAQTARYSHETVFNRVKKLTAEKAKIERSLERTNSGAHSERLETLLASTSDKLSYWQQILAQQAQEQKTYSKKNVKAGDFIKYQNRWYQVARANQKTVTPWFDVERKVTSSYRIAYELITDHKQG